MLTAGKRFWIALEEEKPLQIVGTINAFSSLLAASCGFKAIYLSGAGVANASFGLPDLGVTTLTDVVQEVWRLTQVTSLPLLVDADTGWGNILTLQRAVKEMFKAGAAGIHIEDQVDVKRCGHRPGKLLVEKNKMCDRIKAAVDAKEDEHFVIMARTDALANEGLENTLSRAQAYVESGADMLFIEAVTELDQYQFFAKRIQVPILANITEFGKTPLFTIKELGNAGVSMVLYPLSAFRAMNAAALKVYTAIRHDKTQKNVLDIMQTRDELYSYLNYLEYEKLVTPI